MKGPHYIRSTPYVRNAATGRTETRSKSMMLRIEPTLHRLLAEQEGGRSAYLRRLAIADLQARGLLDKDGCPC